MNLSDKGVYRIEKAKKMLVRRRAIAYLVLITCCVIFFMVISRSDTSDRKEEAHFIQKNVYFTESRTERSFKLFVHDPKDCQYISKSILNEGFWEKSFTSDVTQLLGDTLREAEKRLFLDIGANLGWFSLVAANLGHRVIAVEPMMYNVELLRASLKSNLNFEKLITIHHCAFSESTSTSCIMPSYAGGPQNEGNGQLVLLTSKLNKTLCKEIVNMKRMDDVLQSLDERPYLVKLDVEGHELLALKGGAQVFGRLKPCIFVFEYIEKYVLFAGTEPNDLFNYFLLLGYSINNRIDIQSVRTSIQTDFNYAVNYRDKECIASLPLKYIKLI